MDDVHEFSSKDIGIAATLITMNFPMKRIDWQDRVAFFIFDSRGDCERYAHNYNFGRVLINARVFNQNLKLLKRELYKNNPIDKIKTAL